MSTLERDRKEFVRPIHKARVNSNNYATIDLTTPKQKTKNTKSPSPSLFYHGRVDKNEIINKYNFDESDNDNDIVNNSEGKTTSHSPLNISTESTQYVDQTTYTRYPLAEPQTLLSAHTRDLRKNVCTSVINQSHHTTVGGNDTSLVITPHGKRLYSVPSKFDLTQCFLYLFLAIFFIISMVNMGSYVYHQRQLYFTTPYVLFNQQIDNYNIKEHGLGYINQLSRRGPTNSMFLQYIIDHFGSTLFNHMPYVLLFSPPSINPSVTHNLIKDSSNKSKYYTPSSKSSYNKDLYQSMHNQHNDRTNLLHPYQYGHSYFFNDDASFYSPEHISQCPVVDAQGRHPPHYYHQYPTTRSPMGFKKLFGSVHVTTQAEGTIFQHITDYFNKSIILSSIFISLLILKELWYSAQIFACKHVLDYTAPNGMKNKGKSFAKWYFNTSIPFQTLFRFSRDITIGVCCQFLATFLFGPVVGFVAVALIYLCCSRFNPDYERLGESYLLTIRQLQLLPQSNANVSQDAFIPSEHRRSRKPKHNETDNHAEFNNNNEPHTVLVGNWWSRAAMMWTISQRLLSLAMYAFVFYHTASFLYQFYSNLQHTPDILIEERLHNLSFVDKFSNTIISTAMKLKSFFSRYKGVPTHHLSTAQHAKEFISSTKSLVQSSSTLFSTLGSFFISIYIQTMSALILPISTTRINPQDLPIYLLHFGYCCLTLFLSYTVILHMRSQYLSPAFLSFSTTPSSSFSSQSSSSSSTISTNQHFADDSDSELMNVPELKSHFSIDEINDVIDSNANNTPVQTPLTTTKRTRRKRHSRISPSKIEFPSDTENDEKTMEHDIIPTHKPTKSTHITPTTSFTNNINDINNFASPNRRPFSTDMDQMRFSENGLATIVQLSCVVFFASVFYFSGGLLLPCMYFFFNELIQFGHECRNYINPLARFPLHYSTFTQFPPQTQLSER